LQRLRGRLTYANVISTLALILALGGGTAYAASSAGSSSPAVLKLCAARGTGALRLASGGSCKRGERALNVTSRGTQGPAGPAGPKGAQGDRGTQGERGPAGPISPATILESPDGRFTVRASNSGIVLAGPNGSINYNGTEFLSSGSLAITAPSNLAITAGVGLNITAGAGTNFTTGQNFAQTVGGTYTAQAGDAAVLQSPKVTLGGSSSCPAAARVGSLVASGQVSATGSSSTVFMC
jgi:hypothetical protein